MKHPTHQVEMTGAVHKAMAGAVDEALKTNRQAKLAKSNQIRFLIQKVFRTDPRSQIVIYSLYVLELRALPTMTKRPSRSIDKVLAQIAVKPKPE